MLISDYVIPFFFAVSEKDPNWKLHPEREGRSTMVIITMAKWEWFEEWNDSPLKRRGDAYEEVKKSLGQRMIDQTCEVYPQVQKSKNLRDNAMANEHVFLKTHNLTKRPRGYDFSRSKTALTTWTLGRR